ncbi:MAG: hypothetical protein LBH43_05165 [Treponema sp.]|jgi:hypothetical protein|nr:hypothetical protein [Treponema sp.]
MKKVYFYLVMLLAFCILSCEEPYQTGLFIINKASKTHIFEVHPVAVQVSTKELKPNEEWHYESAFYGKHYVKVTTANNIEATVNVPKYDMKKAAFIEWDGEKFWTYER